MNHTRVFVGDVSPEVVVKDLEDIIFGSGAAPVVQEPDLKSIVLHSNGTGKIGQFCMIETVAPAIARAVKLRLDGRELKGQIMYAYTLPPQIPRRPKAE